MIGKTKQNELDCRDTAPLTMQHKMHVFVYRSFGQFCLSNNYALRLFDVLPVAKVMTVSNDNANIYSII